MLLKLFKSNHPYILFLIPLIGIVLWIPALFNYQINDVEISNTTFIFNWLYNLLDFSPIAPTIFALILLIIESFILIRLNFKFIFIENKTYLPSVLFLILASSISSFQTLHPLLIGNLFLLLAIDKTFAIDKKRDALKRYFESGFFLGLGSIFYPKIYVFIVVIWLTLVILRTFNWREWLSSIFGLITPFVFYLSFLFVTDRHEEVFINLVSILFSPVKVIPLSTYSFLALGFLVLVTLAAIVRGVSIVRIKKINSRKYFNLFFWFFIYVIAQFLIHPWFGYELIVVLAIPFSIIYSLFFTEFKSKWISEVVFTLTLLSIFVIIWFQ